MDFKNIHNEALTSIIHAVGKLVTLTYLDEATGDILATTSNQKIKQFYGETMIDKDVIYFNIIKQDLINQKLPIKDFLYIDYNRKRYEVQGYNYTSTYENIIRLECVALG